MFPSSCVPEEAGHGHCPGTWAVFEETLPAGVVHNFAEEDN